MDGDGEMALEDAVGEALDRVLGRVPARDRAAAFRSLRAELERCLAEAPLTGQEAVLVRARLAAIVAVHEPALDGPVPVAPRPGSGVGAGSAAGAAA